MTTMQSARLDILGPATPPSTAAGPLRGLGAAPGTIPRPRDTSDRRRDTDFIRTRRSTRLLPADLW